MRPDAPPECTQQAACLANEACWSPLLGQQLAGYATEQEAVDHALQCVLSYHPHIHAKMAADCKQLCLNE